MKNLYGSDRTYDIYTRNLIDISLYAQGISHPRYMPRQTRSRQETRTASGNNMKKESQVMLGKSRLTQPKHVWNWIKADAKMTFISKHDPIYFSKTNKGAQFFPLSLFVDANVGNKNSKKKKMEEREKRVAWTRNWEGRSWWMRGFPLTCTPSTQF